MMIRTSKAAKALLEAVSSGYTISKQGTVSNSKGKVLTGSIHGEDYFRYRVGSSSMGRTFSAHQLQAYTKFGNDIFETECVRHMNDNREDNSWDNIELGTHSDNLKDL